MVQIHGSAVVIASAFCASMLAGCGQGAAEHDVAAAPSASPSASAAPPAETIGAAAFCQLVFRDLKEELETKCSAGDGAPRGAAAAHEAHEKCMTMLEASGESAGLTIENERAKACARNVKAAFREGAPSRAAIDLGAFEGCTDLFQGALSEGEACRTALECKAPLVCKAPEGIDKPKEGKCSPPAQAGEKCWPSNDELLFGARSGCAEAFHCPGEPRSDSFGTGGLGLSGIGGGSSRGGGIGLGSIGAIGHSGTGQGFGGLSSSRRNPAPKVRMGATQVQPAGRLPPEVIQRIVRQNFGRFRLCYENGLRANPALEGRVTVRFVIDRTGAVGKVTDAGSTLADAGVVACVTKAFYGLSFPQPEGGVVTVTYPIMFEPPEPARDKPTAPPTPQTAGIASMLGPLDAGGPDAARETAPALGPWTGPAPTAGVCRARAGKGHGCLTSDGCARGFVCVAAQCTAPSPGQAHACQSDHDCSLWQRCGSAGVAQLGQADFGVCVDKKPAKEPCKDAADCRGACVAGACAATCPGK